MSGEPPAVIELPGPRHDSGVSVEQALLQRRSVRQYGDEPLSLEEVSQLLWAAQGITDPQGHRTAPSAGALYPLELYLVAGRVEALPAGIYKYRPQEHALLKLAEGDRRAALSEAAHGQDCVAGSAAVIVICAVYERTAVKYGKRAVRYTHLEAGHASQNVYLQAAALDLGTVAAGGFVDEQVQAALGLDSSEVPLYLMPVGRK